MSSLLTVCVAAFVLFAAGVFVGSVWEQIARRRGLRSISLHLAIRRYLDAEADALRLPRRSEKFEECRQARVALASLVGWEPPSTPMSGSSYRANTAAREERPAC